MKTKNISEFTKKSQYKKKLIPNSDKPRNPVTNKIKQKRFIAGIGSSAGGLEALEKFFSSMPANTGISFVLIAHLDPNRRNLMPEIITHITKMKVSQAEDNVMVKPNCVYVIPPDRNMSIKDGKLHLEKKSDLCGLESCINFFLKSLAEDQKEKSICIILSGMGTDGTMGLKAIKDYSGMAMVQEISSAKYDSMPRSAINTGLADIIAPPEALPMKLIEYVKNYSKQPAKTNVDLKGTTETAFEKVLRLIRHRTGNDLSSYKKHVIYRRIEKRRAICRLKNLAGYAAYLQATPQEIDLLFKDILIGVTNFFRDPQAFVSLKKNAISRILKNKGDENVIRIWAPGCSTGEEAYSLAIAIKECIDESGSMNDFKILIFATDIDKEGIDKARQGIYDKSKIITHVSPARIERFFTKEGDSYKIKDEIRKMVVFASHNIINNPPFTKLDLICCRNLLIYFTSDVQKKIKILFYFALNPDGMLFLGSSENVTDCPDIFKPIDCMWKIFIREDSPFQNKGELKGLVYSPSIPLTMPTDKMLDKYHSFKEIEQEIAEKILVERFTPPSVLINEKGDIIYINKQTGEYLELAAGKANMNVFAMAREGLKYELRKAVNKALTLKKDVEIKNLDVKLSSDYQSINIRVIPIAEPEAMRGLLMVVFEDIIESPEKRKRSAKKGDVQSRQDSIVNFLEKELKYTKKHLSNVLDDMETSQAQLISLNEQLQSSNEVLTISQEELINVNAELQSRIESISRSNDDISNFFESTGLATIFLDNSANIRRFSPSVTKLFNFIQADVGRPITDIISNLKYDNLAKDVKEVNDTLVPMEIEIQSNEGEWYMMKIVPYKTEDNFIDGTVLTFHNISACKELEKYVKEKQDIWDNAVRHADLVIEAMREPLLVLNKSLTIVTANNAFCQAVNFRREDVLGKKLFELCDNKWDIREVMKHMKELLMSDREFYNLEIECDFPVNGRKIKQINASMLSVNGDTSKFILLGIIGLNERG
ncbi:MAG: PAS domain-containing protein [Candidatus Schekmanbacteria bacterium]|nr:PAS domain-containing protein [Candidatus Schekmanbacteria bacterium]